MTATATGSYATQSALAALIGGGQTFDSTDVTLQGLICDRVNQYLESQLGQIVAPLSSATYLYDVQPHHNGPTYRWFSSTAISPSFVAGPIHLYLPEPQGSSLSIGGIRAATLVEVAPYSGGAYVTLAATDYFLRGQAGMTGPYRWLVFSDHPAGSYRAWPEGYATVRVTGTAGWPAIPDDLTNLALVLAQRAWNARQSGYQNVDGVDENGKPIIARFLQLPDFQTLKSYTLKRQQVYG